jgi:hypothetical protein
MSTNILNSILNFKSNNKIITYLQDLIILNYIYNFCDHSKNINNIMMNKSKLLKKLS